MLHRNIAASLRENVVRVGRLWVPGRYAEQMLARYTKQVFCLTHDHVYPYSLRGSAVALRYSAHHFLVWCRHQTQDFSPDDVTFPIENGKTLISGSQHLYVTRDQRTEEQEYADINAMRFVPTDYRTVNVNSEFFDCREDDVWKGAVDTIFFLYGLPTQLRTVSYDPPAIDVRQVVISGRYDVRSNAAHVHRLRLTSAPNFPMDGMSGGPVFHLSRDSSGFFLGLAGVTVRASGSFAYFVDAQFLAAMFKKAG